MLRKYYFELLLILSVVLLVGQLAWPAATRWWRRPAPGSIGVDEFDSAGVELNQKFLVYLPPGYGSGAWPLVIYLHGAGERGIDPNDLRGRGPFAAVQHGLEIPAIVVGPQCRADSHWVPDSIKQLIDHIVSRYNVDRDRVYLVGFSMGAYGTWQTAAAYPDVFAAVVPICGGGDPDRAKAIANAAVWAFHGAKDDVVPVTASEQMIDALRAAGSNPKLTILPDAGHGICGMVCNRSDLWNWLFEQRRGTTTDATPAVKTPGAH